MNLSDFSIGDAVLFGRPNGEQTKGTVVRKGRKNLKVRQDEERGRQRVRQAGTVWTVPPSLCRKVGAGAPVGTPLSTPPPTERYAPHAPASRTALFAKGDKVAFHARGQEVVGFVKRVNRKTVSVNPIDGGRYWRVSPGLLRKVA